MLLLYADFILHGKDNANRRQYKTSLLVFIVEVPLILFKDNANRRQYKASLLVFIVEVPLVLLKDSTCMSYGLKRIEKNSKQNLEKRHK